MKSYVIPELILFSMALGLGLYEIIGWSIRRPRRQDLALALLFLTSALYAAGCAGQYGAGSAAETVPWLRLQSVMLCLSAIGLVELFSAVTGLVPLRARAGAAACFGLFALLQAFDLGSLTWDGGTSSIHRFNLPFGLGWSAHEAETGPITDIQTLASLPLLPYLFLVARRFAGLDRIKGKRLLAIPLVISAAWINDLAVMLHLLPTPYVVEYAFIAAAIYAGLDRAERERDAEERIRASLAEKETLIRELYHRTKNNMQVVSSLLSLHEGELDSASAKAVFKDVRNKLVAMSLVHKKLYESQNLSEIRIGPYAEELVSLLMRSYGADPERIGAELEVEDLPLPIDSAIPLGLVISEIVSNSLKHAFPGGRRGRIRLGLRAAGGELELRIGDDGVGLPAGFEPESAGRMGMKTLFTLVEHQLDGSLRLDSASGLSYEIRIPRRGGGRRLDGSAA